MWTSGGFLLTTCCIIVLIFQQSNGARNEEPEWKSKQVNHKPKLLSKGKLTQVAALTDIDRMFRDDLQPLLIPRVSGTPGNVQARNHIINRLQSLTGWDIDLDRFIDTTPPAPHGDTEFVNIVATRRPNLINGQQPPDAARRLVLACHHDSKYYAPRRDRKEFVGATDSAVPCAMLLDLAHSLDTVLQASPLTMVTLQLMFFDGEEAFVSWSGTDNTYGSRHLARTLETKFYPPGQSTSTELDRIDMLVLLDLIGVANPIFYNHFPLKTGTWFQHMQKVENRLDGAGLLQSHNNPYFKSRGAMGGGIEDDHIPFIQRGIACFHIIATPFPKPWHKMEDNLAALNKPTIDNLNKMLQVFTAEYLHLSKIPKDSTTEKTKP